MSGLCGQQPVEASTGRPVNDEKGLLSDSTTRSTPAAQSNTDLMSADGLVGEKARSSDPSSTSHLDARALVRLIQCSQCSKPFHNPVTLPCGNSLCRSCVPETYRRERVSYPDLPGRRRGFICPLADCAREHTLADCNVDVTLQKLMDAVADLVATHSATAGEIMRTYVEETLKHDRVLLEDMEIDEKPRNWTRPGGPLLATYALIDQGILEFDTNVTYQPLLDADEAYRDLDRTFLSQLVEAAHNQVDCQVCYNLMCDPVTTGCGHTLCRKCLVRTLDHSLHCPVCRRGVTISPSLQGYPSNKTLVSLLNALCPDLVAARAEAVAAEDAIGLGDLDTPLFVCTLGYPGCPTFLRIFEPRYRLMIRRALEGNRQFGMLMYNSQGMPQGELGQVPFVEYGTMLRIENVQFMPDGQSIIETRGIGRFKVKRYGQLDGYTVGSVERVEDLPLAEEERLEARETSLPPAEENDIEGQVSRMSTRQLLILGLEFILTMQSRSAPWLHQRILDAYGGPPNDAAFFPYWLASILPINDPAKYQLLTTTSVRQRLKITAIWIKQMESQRWYQSNACTVL
ncbi:hypothetical protein AAFC00_005990 [Neodothiora populina]|uniref:ATP-dependent protease n=1 Tax=Neodothiora populina TaxID=2781224 RepID=A0ABR3P7X6_9PEZI